VISEHIKEHNIKEIISNGAKIEEELQPCNDRQFEESKKEIKALKLPEAMSKDNIANYLSTSKLAWKYNKGSPDLFKYLHNIGFVEKKGNRYIATDLGKHHGAQTIYKNEKNNWTVWPPDLLEKVIFKEFINDEEVTKKQINIKSEDVVDNKSNS